MTTVQAPRAASAGGGGACGQREEASSALREEASQRRERRRTGDDRIWWAPAREVVFNDQWRPLCRTFLLSKKPKLGLKSPLRELLLLRFSSSTSNLDACIRIRLRLRRELAAAPAMSIFEYNGSAVVAMVGKNCFAIASDRRLGVQLQTVATDFQRVFKIHDKLYIGLSGLATDAQTLYQRLVFRHKLYQLREERDMKPQTFASLVSALLYEKRFGPYFCQPVIAGLGEDNEPFICTMDCIGAKELAKDFVVSGTASESLYGACESMYKPNMEPEELFETISQALQSSVDRDCLSGWGGFVLLV
uniref:Proteasome subunit beta n=1 Tax=Oryza nivara TaxID=4536 RepID=A0A0E0HU14_ORYNI